MEVHCGWGRVDGEWLVVDGYGLGMELQMHVCFRLYAWVYGCGLHAAGFDWSWPCMGTVVRGSVQEEC